MRSRDIKTFSIYRSKDFYRAYRFRPFPTSSIVKVWFPFVSVFIIPFLLFICIHNTALCICSLFMFAGLPGFLDVVVDYHCSWYLRHEIILFFAGRNFMVLFYLNLILPSLFSYIFKISMFPFFYVKIQYTFQSIFTNRRGNYLYAFDRTYPSYLSGPTLTCPQKSHLKAYKQGNYQN